MSNSIKYGNRVIDYSIIYSNRKTLEIAVHPNSLVVITAPYNCSSTSIKQKVVHRAKWITQQINYHKQFEPRTPQKQFLIGETHLYLGKQYRLKIETGLAENVKLKCGYFVIIQRNIENRERTKELLYQWYKIKAFEKYKEYFDLCWNNFLKTNEVKPILRIRKMKKRWGSLSKGGMLTLNIELIKAPKECIEYVITHELCHTVYHNHGSNFYKLLERVMPKWQEIKTKLEIKMS